MMELDERMTWVNPTRYNGLASVCRVRFYQTDLGPVVVLQDLADNQGPSVQNGLEDLIPTVMARSGLKAFEDAMWFEGPHPEDLNRFYRVRAAEEGALEPYFVHGREQAHEAAMLSEILGEPMAALLHNPH